MSSCSTQFPFIDSSHCEIICDGSFNYHCDNSHNYIECSGNNICVDLALLTQCVPDSCENMTTSTYYLQPIYILYRNFHNLFFYNNGKFTPNIQLGCHPNYSCFIDNNNQYVKKVDPEGIYYPFDLYNILKCEFMSSTSYCWDVCSKIEFEKKIAKIKTLFDVDGLCNITCSLTLDELFLSLEANGVVIEPVSGMPDIHHHGAPPCMTVNITTRFSNCNHQVDIVWPFFVDLSAGFNCSHCGGSHNSRYPCDCTPVHSCEAIIHPHPHPTPPGPTTCTWVGTGGETTGNLLHAFTVSDATNSNFFAYQIIPKPPTSLPSDANRIRLKFYRYQTTINDPIQYPDGTYVQLLKGSGTSTNIEIIDSWPLGKNTDNGGWVNAGDPTIPDLRQIVLTHTLPGTETLGTNSYYVAVWFPQSWLTETNTFLLDGYIDAPDIPFYEVSNPPSASPPPLSPPSVNFSTPQPNQNANKLWFEFCTLTV